MTEFQTFIDYSWPFFMGGLVVKVFCWMIAASCDWLKIGFGK